MGDRGEGNRIVWQPLELCELFFVVCSINKLKPLVSLMCSYKNIIIFDSVRLITEDLTSSGVEKINDERLVQEAPVSLMCQWM